MRTMDIAASCAVDPERPAVAAGYQLTAAWNEHDRRQFARYLQHLADETIE
ncbi:hypothetical protein [Nocardia sp. N2S4-5]|uniref:hypothetical protein n=1 Tax=Nocardia sp. N2S4-5 TaxID=3351565 RepID=UPI0037D2760E